MSDYLISVDAFYDQKFGHELATLDSSYSYEFDPSFDNVSNFFVLNGNQLSLAPNVYFDYETTSLYRETDAGFYSLDVSSQNNWSGIQLRESSSLASISVEPEFIDLDELSLFQDQALEEHKVNGVAVTFNLSELSGVDSWRFENTGLDLYFELSSTEIRLRDGYHFEFISDGQLDLQRIVIGSNGVPSVSSVTIPNNELKIRGYTSEGESVYLFDASLSVTDIAETWTFTGQEFMAYEYGETFASLTGSDLLDGTITSSNDLFLVDSGLVSFADDSRYASEDPRIENYRYEGFDLDSSSTVVSYLAHFDSGQTFPGYMQAVTVSDLQEPLKSNALPLNRAGIEDNVVLSSLVSNLWFLDLDVSYQFDSGGQAPAGSDEYSISATTMAWTDSQKDTMRDAMDLISSVCGITFTEVEGNADKNFQLVQTISTYAGYSGYPYDDTFVVDVDDFDINVLVHELCHAVGIGHPFEAGEGTTALAGVVQPQDLGDHDLNTSYWTVMSYGYQMPSALDLPVGTPTPPMSTFDIAALQALYGMNSETKSGDTVWAPPTEIIAIWDGGGTDSIDFSSASEDSVLDLRSAPLDGTADSGGYESYSPSAEFGGAYLISRGVEIEAAYGGSGDDLIRGSGGGNLIDGGGGDDLIYPGMGPDYVIGESGNDIFYLEPDGIWGSEFYARNVGYEDHIGSNQSLSLAGRNRFESVLDGGDDQDTIVLTSSNDAFFLHDSLSGHHESVSTTVDSLSVDTTPRIVSVETIDGGDGDDLIDLTSFDYSLAATAMRLTGGLGDDIIWAGAGDDQLDGGDGDDVLFGGAGADTLAGGLGIDTFQFTASSGSDQITDFDLIDDRIQLFALKNSSTAWGFVDGLMTWGSVEIEFAGLESMRLDDLSNCITIEYI